MSLDRFVEAQEEWEAGKTVFSAAVEELDGGRKRTHWMWFVFPQFPLGQSETARLYAIRDREEAIAYLEHPMLGVRLRSVLELAVTQLVDRRIDPETLFGARIDCLKFVSSATLFRLAAEESGDASVLRLTDTALTAMQTHGFDRCARTQEMWRG